MKNDLLQKYATLKTKLTEERQYIVSRLAAIDAVLAGETPMETAVPESKGNGQPQVSGYVPRAGTLASKILGALRKNGGPMRVKDIASAVKKSPLLVNQGCLLLMKKGNVRRVGRGEYTLA